MGDKPAYLAMQVPTTNALSGSRYNEHHNNLQVKIKNHHVRSAGDKLMNQTTRNAVKPNLLLVNVLL